MHSLAGRPKECGRRCTQLNHPVRMRTLSHLAQLSIRPIATLQECMRRCRQRDRLFAESGIDTYGDTRGRFGLSFYLYALLFVAFDIEVVFIALWALVFNDVLVGGFMGMLVFVGIMELSVLYAAKKGLLTWK